MGFLPNITDRLIEAGLKIRQGEADNRHKPSKSPLHHAKGPKRDKKHRR